MTDYRQPVYLSALDIPMSGTFKHFGAVRFNVRKQPVTNTRNGVPVARLVRVADAPVTAADAIARLRSLSAAVSLGGESVAAMVAEGRKR